MFKTIHNYTELPDSYHKGVNHGTIVSTFWNDLDSPEVKRAIEECNKNCKGAWSHGQFKEYPTITFRFFETYIISQSDENKVVILSDT
jgi:hypothetical protein